LQFFVCVKCKSVNHPRFGFVDAGNWLFHNLTGVIDFAAIKSAFKTWLAKHANDIGAVGLTNFDRVHLGLIDDMAMFADPFAASGQKAKAENADAKRAKALLDLA
jgi:hypothetical protein